ncbi:MAG: 23S rRNA pseudouridine(2604) synthase RluF [Bacteroidota bacterium]
MDQISKEPKRLNKFISETGLCSRREADRLIENGNVIVNGTIALMGLKVTSSDEITVNGKPLNKKKAPLYIAFNKPVGIICTTDTEISDNIVDYINHPERIFPIGRLDRPSQGLILMTNDGDIVNKILRAGNNHEKEYIVSTRQPITPAFIQKMKSGIPILDTVTKKCFVEQIAKNTFRIILTQGLNRQIRRMCTFLNYEVTKLERIRIMEVTLKDLPIGKWRYLNQSEIDIINKLIENSIKTEEASF